MAYSPFPIPHSPFPTSTKSLEYDSRCKFTPQPTGDGSFTFFCCEFGEAFHSWSGARQEAQHKFVVPTQLIEAAQQPKLQLLDICYGLGYNTAAALQTIWAVNPNCEIILIGLELDPTVPVWAIAHHHLNNWPDPISEILTQLGNSQEIQTEQLCAQLLIGDARQTIRQVFSAGFQANAIFLDPFSPPRCPQLWTVEFLELVARCLQPDGRLATYCCAAAVREAMILVGLKIGSTKPVGRRSPGTVASLTDFGLPPLSVQEQEHLLTRAAIPYRDPNLRDEAEAILNRRRCEQQTSGREPSSQWKKRWSTVKQLT